MKFKLVSRDVEKGDVNFTVKEVSLAFPDLLHFSALHLQPHIAQYLNFLE